MMKKISSYFKNLKAEKVIFISFLAIIVFCTILSINMEYDYYWHTKIGENILKTATIPKEGWFSWYALENNLPWIAHEWGSEVILYSLKKLFNSYGPIVYISVLIFTLYTIMYVFNRQDLYKKNSYLNFSFFIIGGVILSCNIMPRPHIISFILISLTLYACYNLLKNEKSKMIYFLPLIAIIWVNVHGGSSNLVYIIPVIFIIAGLFKFNYFKLESKRLTKKQFLKFGIITLVSFLCLFINPYHLTMIIYPYANMSDTLMINNIAEWSSLDVKTFIGFFTFILILLIFMTFMLSKKKIELIDLILILSFSYLTLKSVRFSAFLFIVSSFIIIKYFNESKPFKIHPVFAIVYFLIFITSFYPLKQGIDNIVKEINNGKIDEKIITAIKKEKPKHLYNDYILGGYLIYNEIPVFIDGRADMYSKHNLADYILIQDADAKVYTLLDKYDFDMLLVTKQSSLDYYLEENDDYKIYLDSDNLCLYKKVK